MVPAVTTKIEFEKYLWLIEPYPTVPSTDIAQPHPDTRTQTERSNVAGIYEAPIPSPSCGPGSPPSSTLPCGSTATVKISARFFLKNRATPVNVPADPTPEIHASTRPS